MALYTYQCSLCNYTVEQIRKNPDELVPTCACSGKHVQMKFVLGTPAAPQWNCRTAHSRSKGF